VETPTASGATATAKMTFDKTINVVVEIFVPVAAGLAGFFMPGVLGGGASVSRAIQTVEGSASTISARIAWGVQGIINLAVGAAFWTLRGHGNIIAKAIGGAVGGFFLGGAAGTLPYILNTNAAAPSGLIDKLVGGIQEAANGG
jgi:hypothetical protein